MRLHFSCLTGLAILFIDKYDLSFSRGFGVIRFSFHDWRVDDFNGTVNRER